MEPLVSIIIITYNSQKFVLETLESVKAQTYQKVEMIISDDCSMDGTVSICEKWIEENTKRFVCTKIITTDKNAGIPANCNRGIVEADGEWIKILAGDDLLLPKAIEMYMNAINSDILQEKKAFHGRVIMDQSNMDPELMLSNEWGDPSSQQFNLKEISPEEQFKILLRFCPVSAPTVLLKRSVFDEVGYFDERFKYWEDRPMWIKMTLHGIKFYFIDSEIVKYRRHPESVQEMTGNTLFSRTLLSKDEGFKLIILPHLPFYERVMHGYLIMIRNLFSKVFKNRKTFMTKLAYKILVIVAEMSLNKIRNRYSP